MSHSVPFDDSAAVRDYAVRYMVRRIDATPAEEFPFPHFVVQGLLPDDLYAALLESLPDPSLYSIVNEYKHKADDGAANRTKLSMTNEQLLKMPPPRSALWRGVRDALGAVDLKRAVFRNLRSGLAYRYGTPEKDAEELAGYPMPELYRETSGYSISPHPDTRKKVVTMQLALPSDASQVELGTAFYRLSVKPSALLRRPHGFEKVKQVPFLPNTAYAFVVLNTIAKRSWHGRDQLPAGSGVRNTILNLFYENPAKANPELVEPFRRAA